MKQFLEQVAEDILKRFGYNLSHTVIVFPNKRAGIFFDEHLFKMQQGKPLWAPKYISINELFDSLCPLKADDPIDTICMLHRICQKRINEDFRQKNKKEEMSLDFFYSWGQLLIADFNNIDKNLVDAKHLFSNIKECKKLEDLDLDKEILNNLRTLFNSKEKGRSKLQKEFDNLWDNLYDIYTELNKQMFMKNQGYQGARNRLVIERLHDGKITLPSQYDHYAFVGFNILLQTEHELFKIIKEQGKGFFYWDYDKFFMTSDSPIKFGQRLKKNMENFPNSLPEIFFDNIKDQKIDFVSASSDNAQARYTAEWIKKNLTTEEERRTAIILCDENLLQSVLYSLPSAEEVREGKTVKEVNVTKGFPLSNTPAYSSVVKFFETNKTDYQDNVILMDLLIKTLHEKASFKLEKNDNESWLGNLYAESYYQCYTTAIRLKNLVEDKTLQVKRETLENLFLQILHSDSIPFKGEPATGLQIMGMLETRNLDFEEILMLSVNEGNIPKQSANHSFIPYDVRRAFHLTTDKDESEVYAYNFFRLLQRTHHITYVYSNAVTKGSDQKEMSRFLRQLQLATQLKIQLYTLKEQSENKETISPGIPANQVVNIMKDVSTISPSAMETYMLCPMKYYFEHIIGLKQPTNATDILEANTFGSIYHELMELAYKLMIQDKQPDEKGYPVSTKEIQKLYTNIPLQGKLLNEAFLIVSATDYNTYYLKSKTDISEYLTKTLQSHDTINIKSDKNVKIENIIAAMKKEPSLQLYKPREHPIEYNVLLTYFKSQLKYDMGAMDLHIIELETRHNININGTETGGIIDRLDIVTIDKTPTLRVVDYKTGKYKEDKIQLKNWEQIFNKQENTKHYIFQTFLYCLTCLNKNVNPLQLPVAPALLFSSKLNNKDYSPLLKYDNNEVTDFAKNIDGFKENITALVNKIKTEPFEMTENQNNCNSCPFTLLCNKTKSEYNN